MQCACSVGDGTQSLKHVDECCSLNGQSAVLVCAQKEFSTWLTPHVRLLLRGYMPGTLTTMQIKMSNVPLKEGTSLFTNLIICNGSISSSHYKIIGIGKGCRRKQSQHNFRNNPGICLDRLRKTMKNHGQDILPWPNFESGTSIILIRWATQSTLILTTNKKLCTNS